MGAGERTLVLEHRALPPVRHAGRDHRGARAFAEGLYAAIRNPGMHTPEKVAGGEEQLCLEQLAAFSLLSRWIDQADVETA